MSAAALYWCFICLMRRKASERDSTAAEPILRADTIYQGTALCSGHIILGAPEPDGGDPAAAPGTDPELQVRSARLSLAGKPLRLAGAG